MKKQLFVFAVALLLGLGIFVTAKADDVLAVRGDTMENSVALTRRGGEFEFGHQNRNRGRSGVNRLFRHAGEDIRGREFELRGRQFEPVHFHFGFHS